MQRLDRQIGVKTKNALHEEGSEIRDALQVVPVKVGEQDIVIKALRPHTAEHAIAKLP